MCSANYDSLSLPLQQTLSSMLYQISTEFLSDVIRYHSSPVYIHALSKMNVQWNDLDDSTRASLNRLIVKSVPTLPMKVRLAYCFRFLRFTLYLSVSSRLVTHSFDRWFDVDVSP
jgi:hypothetical protein